MSNLTTEQKRKQRIALDFLAGRCADHLGRKIDDYFNFTEQQMGDDHDWIQWAFPLRTVSITTTTRIVANQPKNY